MVKNGAEKAVSTQAVASSHSRHRRASHLPARNESARDCLSNLMASMLIGFYQVVIEKPSINWSLSGSISITTYTESI